MNQMTSPVPSPSVPPEPIVLFCLTHAGELWKLGTPTPVDDNLRIKRIVAMQDGTVKIFTYPEINSELDRNKTGMEFVLYPMGVKIVGTLARFDVLKALEDEAVLESQDDGFDDEEDEEDGEDLPVGEPIAAAPVAGNGTTQGISHYIPNPTPGATS